jgi:membrane peptidoglycan carboxypeptidase
MMEVRARRLLWAAKLLGLCVLAGALVAGLLAPMVVGAGSLLNQTSNSVSTLSGYLVRQDMPNVSMILDKDGAPVAYLYKDYRVQTPANQIPDAMKAAITAVEDKRFWDHGAVDWFGTVRAMAKNASTGASTQGASTITQQYVKNYLAHVVAKTPDKVQRASEDTIARKVREARLAVDLERTMPKDQILAGYLNVVPFGNQSFGIGAAARTYFGTTPDKLTIAQSALLAAVVNQPGALNPETNPADALARRNLVIDLMSDPHNSIRITKHEAEIAKHEPLGVKSTLQRPPNGCVGLGDSATNGFFCNYVENYLERAGFDTDRLKTEGGYTVRTTMDRKATDAAAAAAKRGVPARTEGIANAMAVVEPGKDEHKVRALVANRDYGTDASQGQTAYDIVSKVQPFGAGSIYKVFTAATAITQGMSIYDTIDVPPSYKSTVYANGGPPYVVGNAEGVKPGPRTLQMALATSPNTAFVILEEKAGLANVVDTAYRMGLRSSLAGVNADGQALEPDGSNGPSQMDLVKKTNQGAFTLGATPTSVLELSNVAATISSHGVYCPPNPVEGIWDRHHRPVPLVQKPCEQAIPPQVADELAQGMSKDDNGGTSDAAAKAAGWKRPLLAKTGTTQQSQSAAFLGSTPQMAGAVLTYADGNHPQGICDGGGSAPPFLCGANGNIYGGKVPAQTWYETMNKVHEGLPVVPLPDSGTPPP